MLPVKMQIINILDFANHIISFPTTEICHLRQRQPQTLCKWVGMAISWSNYIYKYMWWVGFAPWPLICWPLAQNVLSTLFLNEQPYVPFISSPRETSLIPRSQNLLLYSLIIPYINTFMIIITLEILYCPLVVRGVCKPLAYSSLFIHCYSFIVMWNKWAPVICYLVHKTE